MESLNRILGELGHAALCDPASERAEKPEPRSNPARFPQPAISPDQLADLFEEFSQTTLRLQESHRLLESRIVQLRRELAEKDYLLERKKRLESLGLMVAGAAHEIRNPLGSMSLYLDCLSEEMLRHPAPSEGSRLIRQVEEAIAHLNSIVVNMLVFASPSPGAWECCDLAAGIREALDLLKNDLQKAGCSVRFEKELCRQPGGIAIAGDRDQIRCVLVNVIKNAIQAMAGELPPRGGRVIAFDFRQAAGEGKTWHCLLVRDSGPGIPPENLEKVFIPFFTDAGKKGGVGLGLTIVHSLMERLGGKVELANLQGRGLEARLFFQAAGAAGTLPPRGLETGKESES